jgi:uncharacterized CHY-type Zn-finger protein
MKSGVQHKFERVETNKILCGECKNIWYVRVDKMTSNMHCPKCDTKAIAMRVQHIISKGII